MIDPIAVYEEVLRELKDLKENPCLGFIKDRIALMRIGQTVSAFKIPKKPSHIVSMERAENYLGTFNEYVTLKDIEASI